MPSTEKSLFALVILVFLYMLGGSFLIKLLTGLYITYLVGHIAWIVLKSVIKVLKRRNNNEKA